MTKRTSLYEEHARLNARFVEFAGWEMPVMYTSIVEEHHATRKAASVFDVSHMGELVIKGKNAGAFLRSLIPTNLDKITPGRTMYSVLCNEKGGVVDDLFIYMKSSEEYFIVVNASTKDKDLQWFLDHGIDGASVTDLSDTLSKIDLQGPFSKKIAEETFMSSVFESLNRFHFSAVRYRDRELLISQTGYTGELGYEIYMDNDIAPALWNELLHIGKQYGIMPAGLGARDTLRLESCLSLYGHELNDEISPVEAGIGWLISSESEYIAKKILTQQREQGAPRETIVFEMEDRGIPREHYTIKRNNTEIGIVTSGTFSPTFQKGIGMGLVARGSVKQGEEIDIVIRNKASKGRVVQRPFYRYHG